MEPLPRLQARIESLGELRDIIRALRVMAASHVQEAQSALPGIRGYVEIVEDAIAEGAGLLPETETVFPEPPAARDALVVLCSEHGFVGAFNERLLERAEEEKQPGQELIVVGTRGAALASEKGVDADRTLAMPTHVGGVLGVARRICRLLAEAKSAACVFGNYRQGGDLEIAAQRILPLDPALMAGSKRRSPPLHHLAPELLLERLADEYLLGEVTRFVMESLASENGARLRAMETADHNIGDRLDKLKSGAHALRQEAITTELLDVVTGSEAVLNREAP
jgi:F-type H+-transporting ATPase subunit gamma